MFGAYPNLIPVTLDMFETTWNAPINLINILTDIPEAVKMLFKFF